jgi:hypothetical protein
MKDDEEDDDDDSAHLYEAGAFNDEPMDKDEKNATEEQPRDELG